MGERIMPRILCGNRVGAKTGRLARLSTSAAEMLACERRSLSPLSEKAQMHAAQRDAEITRLLNSQGFVSFKQLCDRLEASSATIRRDLERLDRRGSDRAGARRGAAEERGQADAGRPAGGRAVRREPLPPCGAEGRHRARRGQALRARGGGDHRRRHHHLPDVRPPRGAEPAGADQLPAHRRRASAAAGRAGLRARRRGLP